MVRILSLLSVVAATATCLAADGPWTSKHEKGRCALRGLCGAQSFFGSEIPCPDNGLAEEPEVEVRSKLIEICGAKWAEGPICCRDEQVRPHSLDWTPS